MNTLKEQIQEIYFKNSHLTHKEIAKRCGSSVSYVSACLNGLEPETNLRRGAIFSQGVLKRLEPLFADDQQWQILPNKDGKKMIHANGKLLVRISKDQTLVRLISIPSSFDGDPKKIVNEFPAICITKKAFWKFGNAYYDMKVEEAKNIGQLDEFLDILEDVL